MTNLYYTPSGTPGFQTRAQSAQQRNEDAAVAAGFDKLPGPDALAGGTSNYAVDSGVPSALVVPLNANIATAFDGMELIIKVQSAATGASTVTAGALLIAPVVRYDNSPIQPNDWLANQIITLRYNATNGAYQYTPPNNSTAVASIPLIDSAPAVQNNPDASKKVRFDASQVASNTTRVVTFQDRDMVMGKGFIDRVPRTSNTTIAKANHANLIDFTSGSFTQLFSVSSALARGWWALLQNSGTGDIELQAAAAVSTASATSNSIAAGTTWTLATGLAIGVGDTIVLRRTSDPFNQRVTGFVTSYTSGTGVVIVNPLARVGSGTFTDWSVTTCPVVSAIDGLPSYVMYPGEVRLVYVPETGNGLRTIVQKAYFRKAISSYVFIVPPGYNAHSWDGVGGAGGAGSGSRGSFGFGGPPGGAPGRARRDFAGLAPGTGIAQSIGAAGASGAPVSGTDAIGNPGTDGGNTTFGTLATAFGGVGANFTGVSNNTTICSVTGGGSLGRGACTWSGSATAASALGGAPVMILAAGGPVAPNNQGEGGASVAYGVSAAVPGNSVYGGASAANRASTDSAPPPASGSSQFGVAAGGFGANFRPSVNIAVQGGAAGRTGAWGGTGAAAGGIDGAASVGANGAPNAGTDFDMGNPGGGGGTSGQIGFKGGDGSFPGGPGGGGGAVATLSSGASGAGGVSQGGQSLTWGVF